MSEGGAKVAVNAFWLLCLAFLIWAAIDSMQPHNYGPQNDKGGVDRCVDYGRGGPYETGC
jgi:hypothetical protein